MIIVNQTVDLAGKFRYWVELDSGDVVMFKLHRKPKSEQDVYDVADAYVAQKIISDAKAKDDRLEEIDKEIDDLNDEKTKLSATEK